MRPIGHDLRRCARAKGSIVMVGGAGGKVTDWDSQLPLADRYNILRFVISGDAEKDAKELLELCRASRLGAPHILGHSLGSLACCSFCRAAAGTVFRPSSLALVCPVLIPEGSPAGRVLLVFQDEGASADLPMAAKAMLSCDTLVLIAQGHYPFRDSPAWFNREYSGFIGREGND